MDREAEELLRVMRGHGVTFGAAESCTGGMIGERITSLPGSSEVFWGSIVSYANEVKMRVLGVKEETLTRYGAVSEQTAAEMASGARDACGVDVAVSVTGIAGPGGGTSEKPVGTVCFGVATAHGVRTETMHFSPDGTRDEIRRQASSHAMRMACGEIEMGEKGNALF